MKQWVTIGIDKSTVALVSMRNEGLPDDPENLPTRYVFPNFLSICSPVLHLEARPGFPWLAPK